MLRIDDPSASLTLPAPEALGVEGYFSEGIPGSKVATLVRASFLNMIQEELRAVVIAGGLIPSKTAYNQVLLAIAALDLQAISSFLATPNTFSASQSGPTPALGDASAKYATTSFLAATIANFLATANTFTSAQSGPTPALGDSTTKFATMAAVQAASANFLTVANTFSAVQSGPTPALGDSSAKFATTSFLTATIANFLTLSNTFLQPQAVGAATASGHAINYGQTEGRYAKLGAVVTSIVAGAGLSGGTINTTGTIALSTAAGGVGTYLLATAGTTNVAYGATIAGSSLNPAGATVGGNGQLYPASQAATLSGTWQCMGAMVVYQSTNSSNTLFMRIA